MDIVKSMGISIPFKRPKQLAEDKTKIIDVIFHAVEHFESKGICYDYVCLCQPTSPFAEPTDYDKAIKLAVTKDADTVISVYPCDQRHPTIMYTMSSDNQAEWFLKDKTYRGARRQDLPVVYMRSGIVYVFKTTTLMKKKSLYGDRLYAVEVDPIRALGIDSPYDLAMAEATLSFLRETKQFKLHSNITKK